MFLAKCFCSQLNLRVLVIESGICKMPLSPVAKLRSKLSAGLFCCRCKRLVASCILSPPVTGSPLVVSNGCLQWRRNSLLRSALGLSAGDWWGGQVSAMTGRNPAEKNDWQKDGERRRKGETKTGWLMRDGEKGKRMKTGIRWEGRELYMKQKLNLNGRRRLRLFWTYRVLVKSRKGF